MGRGRSAVKVQLSVASALRADFEPPARHRRSMPPPPGRTQSHPVAPFQPLAFLPIPRFCRANLSHRSLAKSEAKRRRSKPVKASQTIFQAWKLGRSARLHHHILSASWHNTQPMVVSPCSGHQSALFGRACGGQAIRNPQSARKMKPQRTQRAQRMNPDSESGPSLCSLRSLRLNPQSAIRNTISFN